MYRSPPRAFRLQSAEEAFARYSAEEISRRTDASPEFDQGLYREAAELVLRRLRDDEAEAVT